MKNRTKKKIGIDARLWNESGVGRYIRNIVMGLDKREFSDNSYYVYLRKKDFESQLFENPHMIKRLADVPWHSISEQFIFSKILKKDNLDLVHFPYFSIPIFYRRKFVVTIHDLIIDHFPTGKATKLPKPIYRMKRLAYKFILKKSVRKATKIIAPSFATKEELLSHYKVKDGKVVVIHEAVDKALKLGGRGVAAESPFILYVGNAYPHKNLERLIKAFEAINDSSVRLVLVGKSDYFYEKLSSRLSVGKRTNIEILHSVSDEKLVSLYKKAEFLVAPSLMEGFGLPILEAMSQGCFVVASDIPSFREVAGESALYFNPQDIADITKQLNVALKINKKVYVEKALLRCKLFNWETAVKKTVKVFEKACS